MHLVGCLRELSIGALGRTLQNGRDIVQTLRRKHAICNNVSVVVSSKIGFVLSRLEQSIEQ